MNTPPPLASPESQTPPPRKGMSALRIVAIIAGVCVVACIGIMAVAFVAGVLSGIQKHSPTRPGLKAESKPTVELGRQLFENSLDAETKALTKLVSFEQTDGMKHEFGGVQFYQFEYQAEVEYLDDCVSGWSGFGARATFKASRNTIGGDKVQKGKHERINGKLHFEKTEKGWRQSG